jgi:RNA polymerase sigma-32 factor
MQHATGTSRAAASYLTAIRRFPMLAADEERLLAERWRNDRDTRAAHQLLNSHLRLVAKIAMSYRRYGLSTSDLMSEGNLGLLHAINRFDPKRGTRFSSYATWWIKAAIHNYVLRSRSLVRIGTTVNQKTLFFNLSKAKRRLAALQEGDLHPNQVSLIANELDVTEQDVIEMNRRLGGDVSLNGPLNQDDDSVEWQDRLVGEEADQETQLSEAEEADTRRTALSVALTALDNRARRIFEARRLMDPPLTLDELATKFHVSRERIRQIEASAFQKVQKAAQIACSGRKLASVPRQRPNAAAGQCDPHLRQVSLPC